MIDSLFWRMFKLILTFLKMKTQNKGHAVFVSKLGAILSKFKDGSTVHVGHQQLKTFFNEYMLKDIITPFISKMDTSQQLSDREKKQHTKVYISLMDCFKQQILMDQFFEKLMESLNKKKLGVSEVICFISKTLLNKIQDPENLYPYVSIILHVFRNHSQLPKIMKHLIEIIDPNVISVLQEEIITLIHDKINNAKTKHEHLDAILSLVINLEEKLTVLNQVHALVSKHLKSDDWNCRKSCVDIGNALLVINNEISQNIHSMIKELKYDKIKHVRDSVNNYEALYKQTYGEELVQKPIKHYSSFRQTKIKAEQDRKVDKSPVPASRKMATTKTQERQTSQDKSVKKIKNEKFFKNAKNSDVIKISEQNQSCLVQPEKQAININENISMEIPQIKKTLQLVNQKANNFEAYLKNRSPKEQIASPKGSKVSKVHKKQISSHGSKNEEKKQQFNYDVQFENFKKKHNKPYVEPESYKLGSMKQYSSVSNNESAIESSIDASMSSDINQHPFYETMAAMFRQFEAKIFERLDNIEQRLSALQKDKERAISYDSSKMVKARVVSQIETQSYRQNSPRSVYYNQSGNQSAWESSICQGVQSNIEEKVKTSIIKENWDQAFTLALTNNKKNILLNLLERCVFPSDRTVEQCILLELKKLLGYTSALKWLKYYLTEKSLSSVRLLKLKQELLKRSQGDSRNYELMRQMVLNEINEKIQMSQ